MSIKKILIAAGGSGGHIFPAVALARTLKEKRPDADIMFVGNNKSLDRRILEKEGFHFRLLSNNKLPYKVSFGLIGFFFNSLFDLVKSFFIIAAYKPDVVAGFGGYISSPVALVSLIFGIPRIAHEQNVVPGRANRLLFGLVDRIAISFNETKTYLSADEVKKTVFTGNPIRCEALKDDRPLAIKRFGLDEAKFTILVVGGSQGAHFLNETFLEALSGLDGGIKKSLQIIHITGLKDYEWAMKAYADSGVEHRVFSFIDRIEEAYSAANLIVTRSGASAIFEIALFGKPMILIPYPYALSHQAENAKAFSRNGAAINIEERNLNAASFRDCIVSLVNDNDRLKNLAEAARRMSVPEASNNLADEILALKR